MPRKQAVVEHSWTQDELLRVKHLGPAIIGREMYDAAQALQVKTLGGVFGPALIATEPEDIEKVRAQLGQA